jgi:hypothetical protein
MTITEEQLALPDMPEVGEPVEVTPGVEQVLRQGLAIVRQRLSERRALRETINADIRTLVGDEETLTQSLRAFERAARRTPPTQEGEPNAQATG